MLQCGPLGIDGKHHDQVAARAQALHTQRAHRARRHPGRPARQRRQRTTHATTATAAAAAATTAANVLVHGQAAGDEQTIRDEARGRRVTQAHTSLQVCRVLGAHAVQHTRGVRHVHRGVRGRGREREQERQHREHTMLLLLSVPIQHLPQLDTSSLCQQQQQ